MRWPFAIFLVYYAFICLFIQLAKNQLYFAQNMITLKDETCSVAGRVGVVEKEKLLLTCRLFIFLGSRVTLLCRKVHPGHTVFSGKCNV